MKSRSASSVLVPFFVLSTFVAPLAEPAVGQLSGDLFAGMPARSIGPMGGTGRISAIDAVESDPNVIYVGAAPGGLWKSVNGGQTWRAVFDDQPVSDIGSVALNQAYPNIVWVGIGEGNNASDPGVPAVYRSLDGGDTWSAAGLQGLEGVHRILLHPANAETAYAGVSGPKWKSGLDRGVYKTTDGGQTWTHVLFVDEATGVSDLVMDPSDPDHLFAAMWSSRRSPWSIEQRGPGSGLFVTQDGGSSWTRLTEEDGLPGGDLGRIALDVFRVASRVVHALVDAGDGVLLRSANRGRTWRTVMRSPDLISPVDDPSGIVADPADESRLFHLASRLSVSDDGGETFRPAGLGSGPGYRALWIHPLDPRLMYGGTDRGLYVSRDGGEHWGPTGELPIARFDHASVDMALPFSVYGGLRLNGSWKGLAYGWAEDGTQGPDWTEVGSEDGFGILLDPSEANHGYAVARSGDLIRFDARTGERKLIRPWAPDFAELRLSRDVPIALDPHDPQAIYYGSQFVHKSVNRGETWQIISGDLSADDPARRREGERDAPATSGLAAGVGAVDGQPEEGGGAITVIAPSPLDRDVIWVGTDEGDIQVTRSAGGEWESVRRSIGRDPDSSRVAHIEPSVHRPGSAFVALDAHRTGNREPFIFRTDNYGRNWRRMDRRSEIEGFVHTLEQDPIVEDLIFAGTEVGLYVSLNRGENWFRWTHGLPPVPVHDLALHPRDDDLVIATHGRGVYVLDDVRPLRELVRNPGTAEVELFLFEPPPAFIRGSLTSSGGDGLRADGTPGFEARPPGALLTFWLGVEDERDDRDNGPLDDAGDGRPGVDIEILDFEGRVVRTLQGPATPGVNRIAWDLREDPPRPSGPLGEFFDAAIGGDGGEPRSTELRSVEVLPGSYAVRISRIGAQSVQMLDVRTDMSVDIDLVQRIAKYQAVQRALDLDATLRALRAAVASVHAELERVIEWVGRAGIAGEVELIAASRTLGDELRELADFESVMRYRPGVLALTSSYDQPTEGERLDLIRMEEALDELTRVIGDFLILDINRFARRVEAAGWEVSFFIGPIG